MACYYVSDADYIWICVFFEGGSMIYTEVCVCCSILDLKKRERSQYLLKHDKLGLTNGSGCWCWMLGADGVSGS